MTSCPVRMHNAQRGITENIAVVPVEDGKKNSQIRNMLHFSLT